MSTTTNVPIQLRGITKTFGSVTAVQDVSLTLLPGEVHAVIGENGAGKSTLMSVLYGMIQPDSGVIVIDGVVEQRFPTSRHAIRAGIGMVHQHFTLAPSQSVADNIVIGFEPRGGFFGGARTRRDAARELMERTGLVAPLDTPAADLTIGMRQRVEILKALYRGAHTLILDEPTAVLAQQAVVQLCGWLRGVARGGMSIVYISHKLPEILKVADRVSVLRRSRLVESEPLANATADDLARKMTGSDRVPVEPASRQPGEPVLTFDDVSTSGRMGSHGLEKVSLTVRAGEVVGVAAIEGNGQSELLQVAAGLGTARGGTIRLDGETLAGLTPAERRARGLAYIPEDRHHEGLALDATASETLESGRRPARRRDWLKPVLGRRQSRADATAMSDYDVRPVAPGLRGGDFSGGNQQKLVFARELERTPKVLLLGQPSRGVDVHAADFLHKRIINARDAGAGVLLVSAELDEIFRLSDRVVVLYEGQVVTELDPAIDTPADAGLYMTGARR